MESPTDGKGGKILLSLDNGGTSGIGALLILRVIMKRLQARLNLNDIPRPCDYFDFIGGVGTGGLSAILLGRACMTVDSAIKAFVKINNRILSSPYVYDSQTLFRNPSVERAVNDTLDLLTFEDIKISDEYLKIKYDTVTAVTYVIPSAARIDTTVAPMFFQGDTYTDYFKGDHTIKFAVNDAIRNIGVLRPFPGHERYSEHRKLQGVLHNPICRVISHATCIFPRSNVAAIVSIGAGPILYPEKNFTRTLGAMFQFNSARVETWLRDVSVECSAIADREGAWLRYFEDVYYRFDISSGLGSGPLKESEFNMRIDDYIWELKVNQALDEIVDHLIERKCNVPLWKIKQLYAEWDKPRQIFHKRVEKAMTDWHEKNTAASEDDIRMARLYFLITPEELYMAPDGGSTGAWDELFSLKLQINSDSLGILMPFNSLLFGLLQLSGSPERRGLFLAVQGVTRYNLLPVIDAGLLFFTKIHAMMNYLCAVLPKYHLICDTAELSRGLEKDFLLVQESIHTALRDKEVFRIVVNYKGINAKRVLDLFEELLDSSDGSHRGQYNMLHAAITLSRRSGEQPTCLQLQGVTQEGDQPIDSGGFGEVYKGKWKKHAVCIKVIKVYGTSNVTSLIKDFSTEALIWRHLQHINVLPFYGVYLDQQNRLCLVSPWLKNGNITEYLKRNPSANRLSLAQDVVSGLAYVHAQKIVHGDLKGANILVSDSRRACLADFGQSSILHSNAGNLTSLTSRPSGGTMRWQSPEVLDGAPTTFSSDIYSMACVLYEIFTGQIPFVEFRYEGAVILRVLQGERAQRPTQNLFGLTDAIWDIIEVGWSQYPDSRLNAEEMKSRLGSKVSREELVKERWDTSLPSQIHMAMRQTSIFHSGSDIGALLKGWLGEMSQSSPRQRH